MSSFNKVILMGNLTRDPELRYTGKGTAIAKLSLAVNRKWNSETGEKKEEVTFVELSAFGKQAEVLGQYLLKGMPLFIEGRLQLEQWNDKQTGAKRSKLSVVIETFQFLASGKDDRGAAPDARPPSTTSTQSTEEPPPNDGDDVPF